MQFWLLLTIVVSSSIAQKKQGKRTCKIDGTKIEILPPCDSCYTGKVIWYLRLNGNGEVKHCCECLKWARSASAANDTFSVTERIPPFYHTMSWLTGKTPKEFVEEYLKKISGLKSVGCVSGPKRVACLYSKRRS